jgi:hypothetical protein
MRLRDISLAEAEAFLAKHERHYKTAAEPLGAMAVVEDDGQVHGVVIVGRRAQGVGELTHVYCDGVSQGYTLLYGAAWRVLKAYGYESAIL